MNNKTPEVSTSTERESLLSQFNSPETLQLAGGRSIKVIDVQPENPKTDIPLVVAPGWAASPKVSQENILTLAELGRRVLSVKSYHGVKTTREQKSPRYPDVELRKAVAIIEMLDEKGIDLVDAVGHSEAGIYLTIAASLFPDKFRNLLLLNPAGMAEKGVLSNISVRFSGDTFREYINSLRTKHHRKSVTTSFIEKGKAILSNPAQVVKQIRAIYSFQISEELKKLKAQGKGVSIIHAGRDQTFPMSKVQKVAQTDQFHGFYSVAGTHNTIYLEPRTYSRVVDEALTALENRE